MPIVNFPLEQQIAQMMMLGYAGAEPGPVLARFLKAGLGGVIFFRDNFQHLQQASDVKTLLDNLRAHVSNPLPQLFLSLDQEGGQVERLPCHLFPSLITPRAIGLSQNPEALARQAYGVMAEHLSALGFNLNYFPTLDVNLEPKNPIIGVRSFADEPERVWRLAHIAMDAFARCGIVAVGKHFPGHGNGTVDSHLKLPYLRFTEAELTPFQQAITAGIPTMLVSHGYYPDLQPESEFECPASASPTIMQTMLRQKLGFQGVIISDDMCMGAITQGKDPVEAAIQAIEAGIDLLVYKQSTDVEWQVYQGLIAAVRAGRLSAERIDASCQRILALKQAIRQPVKLSCPPVSEWTLDYLAAQSDAIARQAVRALSAQSGMILPLDCSRRWLLIHPDRRSILNYSYDIPLSPELPDLLRQAGFTRLRELAYEINGVEAPVLASVLAPSDSFGNAVEPALPDSFRPEGILFVTFNPLIQPVQRQLYAQIRECYPQTPLVLVSAGTAYDQQVFPEVDLHIALCSYRPPSMRALAAALSTADSQMARELPGSSAACPKA